MKKYGKKPTLLFLSMGRKKRLVIRIGMNEENLSVAYAGATFPTFITLHT
jgi:hypothetical protein